MTPGKCLYNSNLNQPLSDTFSSLKSQCLGSITELFCLKRSYCSRKVYNQSKKIVSVYLYIEVETFVVVE